MPTSLQGLAIVILAIAAIGFSLSADAGARSRTVAASEASAPPCSSANAAAPVGSVDHVYAIPNGCVRLRVPTDDSQLPTIVVRMHRRQTTDRIRWFPLSPSNLDRTHGSIGICGRSSSYLFLVTYPYVTVVAQQIFNEGGTAVCDTSFDHALFWTVQLTPSPTVAAAWSNRP